MITKKRGRLHTVIDAKLSAILTSLPEPPPWNEPWLRLGTESTWEERLLVCQTVRDSGSIPAKAGYFLVSWIIEDLATVGASQAVDSLEFMNRRESRQATDRRLADLMDRYGEKEMANQFRTDPIGHARHREVGRRFFFGAKEVEPLQDPAWITEFVKIVSSSLLTDRSTPPVGFRYRVDDDNCEISVYPIHEGCNHQEAEGSGASAAFDWNIEELRSVFDGIDGSGWYAVRSDGTECPYLWIEGNYQTHEVFLRLLPGEPDHIEPGEKREN
jgi:hypothetical protein